MMMNLLKDALTLYVMIPSILFLGGYFSFKLGFLQLTKLPQAFHLVTTQKKKGSISSFSAVTAVLGGNLGTGNISGIAVALATGGPGALFWMWMMALLASTLKFIGAFLGVDYREKDAVGEWVGGPMYYLKKGLNRPFLAKIFCVFTILSALTVGNLIQVHALSLPIKSLGLPPLLFGGILAVLTGGVIWGGLQRFAAVVSAVVPVMALFYIGTCLLILALFYDRIGEAVGLILNAAFGFKSMAGGAAGFTIFQAMRSGFDRGLFATDSGLGLESIIHASVTDHHEKLHNKVVQGIISILSPLLVMVVCSMTGLVLLVTGAWENVSLESTLLCMEAFTIGLGFPLAGHIVTVTLFFFAFTTILTWSFCADKSVEFLFGRRFIKVFQTLFVGMIPLGALPYGLGLWTVADICINLMFIVNMVGIVNLSANVIRFTKAQLSSAACRG